MKEMARAVVSLLLVIANVLMSIGKFSGAISKTILAIIFRCDEVIYK